MKGSKVSGAVARTCYVVEVMTELVQIEEVYVNFISMELIISTSFCTHYKKVLKF